MNIKGLVLFSAILLIMSSNSKNDNCKNKNVQSNQKQVNEYFNPIIQGFYPDPSICRVGEDYYMALSSFEYFPGVPIFHSKDLIHWEQIGHALTRKSQLNLDTVPASRGIYASTLRFHNDTFYMITTNTIHGGNFVVHTADPYGEWSVPVWIDMPGIDPSLFWDDDGKVYAQTSTGIFQAEIDLKTGKRKSPLKRIWMKGSGGNWIEAPHIYKKDGYYYLMLAEGGTYYGHMVTIARSKNIWGPYEGCPENPILTHRNTYLDPIQGTGHGDLIQDHQGDWWMVFLAFRVNGQFYHTLGRETFLAPVTWKNGWPVVNNGEDISMKMKVPTLPLHPFEEKPNDDFNSETLGLKWNFLRYPPDSSLWNLTGRKGWLMLKGTASDLNDRLPKTFIGRRQQDYYFEATTLLDFDPASVNEEAGVTLLMNDKHHYEIFISRNSKGQRTINARYRIGTMSHVVASEVIAEYPVEIKIEGDTDNYKLSYRAKDANDFKLLFEPEIIYLSVDVTGGFTGVYIGLYATGNGKQSKARAYFDYLNYKGADKEKYTFKGYKPDIDEILNEENEE
jgi:xylan 1,4-beta-xylosidase